MSLQQYNVYEGLTAARVVATTNQTGTYVNGPINNGVGATFTYATGVLTIDSVTLNVGDRLLLQAQSSANQNGIYIVKVAGATGVAAVLQRAADYQCIEQLKSGQYISVAAGTANAGSIWTLVEPKPAQFGISNMVFVGNGGGASLQIVNNLSELANPTAQAAALENLGIHSAKATGAGGSATVTITDAKIVAASVVVASVQASANAVSVEKVTPGVGSLVVLLSADPGANTIAYHAITAVE